MLTFIVRFVFALAVGIYGAFVFSIIWGWFLTPLGLPDISIVHAWALLSIMTLPHLLTRAGDTCRTVLDTDPAVTPSKVTPGILILYSFLLWTVTLGFMWVAQLLM